MARIKQAIQIVNYEIERMEFFEEYQFIKGMINMAERLDKLTHAEAQALVYRLDEKYETLSN